ncbi:MAG: hypothetical protein M5U14_09330 [Acidimicrobiia bacterium]|nr:hypothetical protein [Acidimicrobiia bacterium]
MSRPSGRSPQLQVVVLPGPAELRRRLPRLLPGILLIGSGAGLVIEARLGVSPYDVFHQGVAARTGLTIGTVVILVGLLVLLAWIPLRQPPGLGTIVNTLCTGLVMDATIGLLPDADRPVLQWPMLLGGILVVSLGTGLYIGAGLGPGPRDGLMTGIAARGHPLWRVRTGLETGALVLGWSLGGDVGVGTLLFALSIGPFGHWFLARLHLGVGGVDPDSRG